MKERVTRLDDCQYRWVSQIHYTLTNFADPCERFSHDAIHRYLRGEKITSRLVGDNARPPWVRTPRGYLIFEDTVVDKNYSVAIELVRSQDSGNAKTVLQGIGVGTCVYVNPELDRFGLIDDRL